MSLLYGGDADGTIRLAAIETAMASLGHGSFPDHGALQTAWLGRASLAKPTQEFVRETLLENPHHDRRRVVGFADQ
jgi:hypothetical protein